ncbi:MAG: hypothetical protein VX498_15495, partial [Myxococcota bacterium]|nr:hypothetical protein [Myxococcota bacterium]
MPQADDYEDGYYDDDDYYDDESQGPSVLVLVLVAVVLLMGLGAVCIGGWVYLEKSREPNNATAVAPLTTDSSQPVGEGEASGEAPEEAVVDLDPVGSAPEEAVVSDPEPDFTPSEPAPVRVNRDATRDRAVDSRWQERSSEGARDRSSEGSSLPSRGSRARSSGADR